MSESHTIYIDGSNKQIYHLRRQVQTIEDIKDIAGSPLYTKQIRRPVHVNGKAKTAIGDINGNYREGELVLITGELPQNPLNEDSAFSIGETLASGYGFLGVHEDGSPSIEPLESGLRTETKLHPIEGDIEQILDLISFTPKQDREPDITVKPYDIDQLESYLNLICDTAIETHTRNKLIQLIAKDSENNKVAQKCFKTYQFPEMKRWCLDNYDFNHTTYFDWTLQALDGSVTHSLASSTKDKLNADFILRTAVTDHALIFNKNKRAKKNAEYPLHPIAGLPIFTNESEALVSFVMQKGGACDE